ncbi:MAG: aminoacetone oxidase family FAD-binding enzyme [Longimicrobiales bacterium]
MAALFAARGGRSVILLERTSDGGRKILISGGGRCNVLPSRFDPAQYFTDSSPNILRNILRSWPDHAQRRFFEDDLGLQLELEPETGKLFPVTHRARDVRDRLVRALGDLRVEVRFNATARGIERTARYGGTAEADAADSGSTRWSVQLSDGASIEASSVIIATGGLSVPKTGSDGIGLRIARSLGHTVRDTYAALTPLTMDPPLFGSLAGVSFPVTLHVPQPKKPFMTHGGFLFTHVGYSGPSVLDVSHFAVRALERGGEQPIYVQWADRNEAEWDAALREGNATVGTVMRRHLPERLLDRMLADAQVPAARVVPQLRRDERLRLVEMLARFPLPYNGHEGYRKAEVTGGGVALEEIEPSTMQSRLHPGLYFCGEVLDAFGPIGGYNFAWAWATGRLAGLAAGRT